MDKRIVPINPGEDRLFNLDLYVKLNRSELIDRGKSLAECHVSLGNLIEAKRDLTAKIKSKEAVRDALATIVDQRQEKREVKCFEHKNFDLGVVEIWRTDTNEMVSEREMKGEDKQPDLI